MFEWGSVFFSLGWSLLLAPSVLSRPTRAYSNAMPIIKLPSDFRKKAIPLQVESKIEELLSCSDMFFHHIRIWSSPSDEWDADVDPPHRVRSQIVTLATHFNHKAKTPSHEGINVKQCRIAKTLVPVGRGGKKTVVRRINAIWMHNERCQEIIFRYVSVPKTHSNPSIPDIYIP